jgi:hypothetical protein
MDRAGDQINHQEQQDGTEPPRMVHIEEAEKIKNFIETDPVFLNVLCTGSILFDDCADNRENGEQDKERNGEFEGTEKIVDKRNKSSFLAVNLVF